MTPTAQAKAADSTLVQQEIELLNARVQSLQNENDELKHKLLYTQKLTYANSMNIHNLGRILKEVKYELEQQSCNAY